MLPSGLLPGLLVAAQIASVPMASSAEIAGSDVVRVEREAWLMGTRARLTVEAADRGTARAASEGALEAVEATEALLSTWTPTTELSRLNVAPVGESTAVSAELAPILAAAWRWRDATDGAFEPVVGALVDAWDLRGDGRRPSAEDRATLPAALGPRGVDFDAGAARWTRLHPDAWVDAGGFGKGAGLARAAGVLDATAVRRARLDLGGQLWLAAPDGEPWTVAVAHPLHRTRVAARLELADVSVATSGASERGITVDGERLGHLLDPRTGAPVPTWGSVTVVHPDPLAADALATALYVLGPDEGPRWLRSHPEIAALFLEIRDERVIPWHTDAMERWIPYPSVNQPSKDF